MTRSPQTNAPHHRGPLHRAWDRAWYEFDKRYAVFWTRFLADVAFVHINKTGGTSIERALGLPFQHRTAVQIRNLMGRSRYERCFSFAFVRNPWDKVASHYQYRIKANQTDLRVDPIPFNDWVLRSYGERDPDLHDNPMMFMPQVDWISDEDGTLIVDFVGRFERLEKDFRKVCRRIGREAELPHLKSSGHHNYREMYNEEARRVVAERFASDLECFEYTFASPAQERSS